MLKSIISVCGNEVLDKTITYVHSLDEESLDQSLRSPSKTVAVVVDGVTTIMNEWFDKPELCLCLASHILGTMAVLPITGTIGATACILSLIKKTKD